MKSFSSCAPLRLFTGADVVRGVSIFTNEFDQLGVRHDPLIDFDRPRFRVRLGIIDGDGDFQASVIWTAEALGYLGGIGHRTAANVKPLAVVETGGFDHKSVAFPMPDRVAVVPGFDIIFVREFPAIQEYLPE